MKYVIIHKLTQKPIRNTNAPYDIVEFETKVDAQKIVDMKNRVIGPFYEIKEKGI